MAQTVVFKIMAMKDVKSRQNVIEAAADIFGVDSIAADITNQTLTVIGTMDESAMLNRLEKLGKVEIVSVAKEEK